MVRALGVLGLGVEYATDLADLRVLPGNRVRGRHPGKGETETCHNHDRCLTDPAHSAEDSGAGAGTLTAFGIAVHRAEDEWSPHPRLAVVLGSDGRRPSAPVGAGRLRSAPVERISQNLDGAPGAVGGAIVLASTVLPAVISSCRHLRVEGRPEPKVTRLGSTWGRHGIAPGRVGLAGSVGSGRVGLAGSGRVRPGRARSGRVRPGRAGSGRVRSRCVGSRGSRCVARVPSRCSRRVGSVVPVTGRRPDRSGAPPAAHSHESSRTR